MLSGTGRSIAIRKDRNVVRVQVLQRARFALVARSSGLRLLNVGSSARTLGRGHSNRSLERCNLSGTLVSVEHLLGANEVRCD